ncbi:hypothetical protein B0H19DRAFT_120351 [Mycena capillaripes]|nr:hypothetical protein B0H19DRAFT_120351 [Mycena capillaripes]
MDTVFFFALAESRRFLPWRNQGAYRASRQSGAVQPVVHLTRGPPLRCPLSSRRWTSATDHSMAAPNTSIVQSRRGVHAWGWSMFDRRVHNDGQTRRTQWHPPGEGRDEAACGIRPSGARLTSAVRPDPRLEGWDGRRAKDAACMVSGDDVLCAGHGGRSPRAMCDPVGCRTRSARQAGPRHGFTHLLRVLRLGMSGGAPDSQRADVHAEHQRILHTMDGVRSRCPRAEKA